MRTKQQIAATPIRGDGVRHASGECYSVVGPDNGDFLCVEQAGRGFQIWPLKQWRKTVLSDVTEVIASGEIDHRITDRVRTVLVAAEKVASEKGRNFAGLEEVLIAILDEGHSVAAVWLRQRGIDSETAKAEL